MRRGFTLLELAFVIALMAVLTTLSVGGYDHLVRRAKAAEAQVMLQTLADAELRRLRDHGAFLACGGSTFDPEEGCWRALGVRFEGKPRYGYRVELTGDSFAAVATGDLDGDGVRSELRLEGETLRLVTRDELE